MLGFNIFFLSLIAFATRKVRTANSAKCTNLSPLCIQLDCETPSWMSGIRSTYKIISIQHAAATVYLMFLTRCFIYSDDKVANRGVCGYKKIQILVVVTLAERFDTIKL